MLSVPRALYNHGITYSLSGEHGSYFSDMETEAEEGDSFPKVTQLVRGEPGLPRVGGRGLTQRPFLQPSCCSSLSLAKGLPGSGRLMAIGQSQLFLQDRCKWKIMSPDLNVSCLPCKNH